MSDKPIVPEKDKPFILAILATVVTVLTVVLSVIPQTAQAMQTNFDKVFTFDTTIMSTAYGYYFANKITAKNQAKPQQ